MSHSTFSYCAFLFSKYQTHTLNSNSISNSNSNSNPKYVFCLTNEYYTKYKPIDFYTSDEWIIIDNKKYILNFNKKLLIDIYKFYKKKI